MMIERSLFYKTWQTDFRCFITDEGLQGFLARFGGVPTNVGSGGGVQPLALSQPRRGNPALMASDGLFSFGADIMDEDV